MFEVTAMVTAGLHLELERGVLLRSLIIIKKHFNESNSCYLFDPKLPR